MGDNSIFLNGEEETVRDNVLLQKTEIWKTMVDYNIIRKQIKIIDREEKILYSWCSRN